MKRLVICTKDVEILLGKSRATAARILSKVRAGISKPKTQLITLEEFCDYFGLDLNSAKKALG